MLGGGKKNIQGTKPYQDTKFFRLGWRFIGRIEIRNDLGITSPDGYRYHQDVMG